MPEQKYEKSGKILIITVGMSPAVVTETIWALFQRKPAWVPDAVHLLTTTVGATSLERVNIKEKLKILFEQHGHPYVEPSIDVPKNNGKEIKDIRLEGEHIAFADQITQLIAGYTVIEKKEKNKKKIEWLDRDDTELHVSLAGGRKTQSGYAKAAMGFFARPRDELSHTLIEAENQESYMIENSYNNFFWPNQEWDAIHKDRNTKEETKIILEEVIVDLPKIPFVRLRVFLKGKMSELFSNESISYASVVDAVQNSINTATLTLHPYSRTISIGEESIQLPNLQFAIYAVAALSAEQGWRGAGIIGIGNNHTGWLTYNMIFDNEDIAKHFVKFYASTFKASNSSAIIEMETLFKCAFHYDEQLSDLENEYREQLTGIEKDLKDAEDNGDKKIQKTSKKDKDITEDTLKVIREIGSKSKAIEEIRDKISTPKSKIGETLTDKIRNSEIMQRIWLHTLSDDGGGQSRFGIMLDHSNIDFDWQEVKQNDTVFGG